MLNKATTYRLIDHVSGNPITPTDNGLKDGDILGINQESKPLELDENGLPVDWAPPEVISDGDC